MGRSVMSSFGKITRPLSGLMAPIIMLKEVLLPAPFWPSNPTISPSLTSKLTCFTTVRFPYDFVNPSALNKFILLYKLNIIQRPEYEKCLADDVLFRDEFPNAAVIAVSAVVAQHEVILLAQLYWLGCAPCAGREIGIINIVEYFDIFKGRIYMSAAKTNPARIKRTPA